jgi:hypothetical protein
MTAMRKPKPPAKEIDTKALLKKVRKPPAPPTRVHSDDRKYKRSRGRIPEQDDEV